jgi:hypothetical protein
MPQHKSYRSTVNRTRPRCATCPHYIDPQPPMRLDGPGNCTLTPGQIVLTPQNNALRQVEMIPMTFLPVKHRHGYCGSHPDFLRWWSEIRREFGTMVSNDSEGEQDDTGRMPHEGTA